MGTPRRLLQQSRWQLVRVQIKPWPLRLLACQWRARGWMRRRMPSRHPMLEQLLLL